MADEAKQKEVKQEAPAKDPMEHPRVILRQGVKVLQKILKTAPEHVLGEQAALALAALDAAEGKQPGIYCLAGIYLAALDCEGQSRGVDVKALAAKNMVQILTGTGTLPGPFGKTPMAQA